MLGSYLEFFLIYAILNKKTFLLLFMFQKDIFTKKN